MHAGRPLDDERGRWWVITERVQLFRSETFSVFLLLWSIDSTPKGTTGPLASNELPRSRPLPGLTDHFPDELDEDGALVASLDAELPPQVPQLADGTAAEAEGTTADAEVDLAAAGKTGPTATEPSSPAA